MIYTGTITTDQGQPAIGGVVKFILPDGSYIDYVLKASALGEWSIDTDTDGGLIDPGNKIEFSAPGFYPYSISANLLPQNFTVTLTSLQKSKTLVYAGLGIAGVLLLLAAKKKKIFGPDSPAKSGFSLPPVVLQLLPFALVGGFALWYLNKKDPKQTDSDKLAPLADQQLQAVIDSGVSPTISAATAESLSATIVEATDDCGTDENALYTVFGQLNNDADMWLLVKTFGVRQIKSCFSGNWFSNTPYNLPQIITSELSSTEMVTLNNILSQKGIAYQF